MTQHGTLSVGPKCTRLYCALSQSLLPWASSLLSPSKSTVPFLKFTLHVFKIHSLSQSVFKHRRYSGHTIPCQARKTGSTYLPTHPKVLPSSCSVPGTLSGGGDAMAQRQAGPLAPQSFPESQENRAVANTSHKE